MAICFIWFLLLYGRMYFSLSFSVALVLQLCFFCLCTLLDWLWVRYCMIGEPNSVENDSNLLGLSVVLGVQNNGKVNHSFFDSSQWQYV